MKVDWHYISTGDPSGHAVVFLHGFMGSGRIWSPVMESISGDLNKIALDLPGHGKTECDLDQLNFDTFADSLIEFFNDNNLKPAALCGYSLGGRLALYTALRHPGFFDGLILESCNPGIEDEGERRDRLESDRLTADKLKNSDMRDFLKDWYRQPVFSHLSDELKSRIIDKKRTADPVKLAGVLIALSQGNQPSLWAEMDKWHKPSLIIAGEKDRKYVDIARRIKALKPHANLSVIGRAGHIVHLENRSDFISVLNCFLENHIL